jgi:hypothetical protein
MLEELIVKNVKAQIGVFSGMTDLVKGTVILVEYMWMKLQVKDGVEFLNLDKVSRLSVLK